jgi:tRNA pseudouridine55 synthase
VLVVDKPAGVTSFDVVGRVRRRLGVRRVGHAGTLDPDATGVLPVLVGEATKLMAYLADHDKEYRAVIRFGIRTDTQDMSGRVLSETPVTGLTVEIVTAAAQRFIGRIRQTPPMYSALHHDGRRLYELARQGVEVPREAREVIVHSLEVEDVTGTSATLTVVCGKGTYVRTLAADLGDVLGVGAAVERLIRLRVGPFTLTGAVSWEELDDESAAALGARMASSDAAVSAWAAAHLDVRAAAAFRHGQAVAPPRDAPAGGLVRVYDEQRTFMGVGQVDPDGGRLRPVRLLHADRPDTRVLPA